MALGRGIGAILDEVEEAYNNDLKSGMESVSELSLDSIKANPFQPRKIFNDVELQELAHSIEKHGLLQPIVVIKKDGQIQLIAGERRLRASKIAGKETIRAIIADVDYSSLRELALIENIQRSQLNPIELALSLKELIDEHTVTHENLAKMIHKSRTYVTNLLRLLHLNTYTQEQLSLNKLSMGHAKVLVGLDEKFERKLVDSIINQKLSVREVEQIIRNNKKSEVNEIKDKEISSTMYNFENVLEQFKNEPYKVKMKKNSIEVIFSSQNDIDAFISKLS